MSPEDPDSYIFTKKYDEKNIQMMNIVEDILKYMSERQPIRAKTARKTYQALGTPTVQDLKAVIRMNLIKNAEITTEDVNLAEKAFGPDIGNLKGKTTTRRPAPAFSNEIEIPKELLSVNEAVVLSIDGLNVNGLKFVTSISPDIDYRTCQYVLETKVMRYEITIQEVYDLYKNQV